jgi:hypothetical protein
MILLLSSSSSQIPLADITLRGWGDVFAWVKGYQMWGCIGLLGGWVIEILLNLAVETAATQTKPTCVGLGRV